MGCNNLQFSAAKEDAAFLVDVPVSLQQVGQCFVILAEIQAVLYDIVHKSWVAHRVNLQKLKKPCVS